MAFVLRLLVALIRAAIPIVGVFVLGWPIANVLFFFWFELVTAGVQASLVILRDAAARPRTGNIPLPVAVIFVFAGMQVPSFLMGALLARGPDLGAKLAYGWSLLGDPALRASALFQLLAAVVAALLWSHERERAERVVDDIVKLQVNRFIAACLLGFGVAAISFGAAIATGADPERVALLGLTCALAVAWAASDLDPARFGRFVDRVIGAKRDDVPGA